MDNLIPESRFADFVDKALYLWEGWIRDNKPYAPRAQHNFAAFVGWSPAYLSDVKAGKYLPNPHKLARFSAALAEIDPDLEDEAYEAAGQMPPQPADWRARIINKLIKRGCLTDEDLDRLAETAKKLAERNKSGGNLEQAEIAG